MKTPQKASPANTKHAPANTQANGEKGNFFSSSSYDGEHASEQPFFENTPIRRKMTVNEPGDHFEKQADQVADHVVKEISQPKPAAQPAAVQKKEEKKEDKQEKEQSAPEKELQRKPVFDSDADPNEGNTLKRSSQSNVPDVSPQTQQRIEGSKGGGEPLPANTREEMENAMGADLSSVRIHHDNEAASLSHDLQAQAFTHGNDVYFGAGKYDTQSSSGQHLLAHELAHTQQQGGGVKKKNVIQRAAASTPGAVLSTSGTQATVADPIDTKKKVLYVPSIKIPDIKYGLMPAGSKANYAFKKTNRSGTHLTVWNTAAVTGSSFTSKFTAKKQKEIPADASAKTHFLTLDSEKHHSSLSHIITGDDKQIEASITRPFWDKAGKNLEHGMDVDHKVELQIGGLDGEANLWLLDASKNRSSGGNIDKEINSKVSAALDKVTMPAGQKKPSVDVVRETYTITAGKVLGGLQASGTDESWELADIKAGEHLKKLTLLSSADQAKFKLADATNLSLITSERYGAAMKIPKWVPGKSAGAVASKNVDHPIGPIKSKGADMMIGKVEYTHQDNTTILNAGSIGNAYVDVFMGSKIVKGIKALKQPIEATPGFYGGRLNKLAIKTALSEKLTAKGFSPIEILEIDIDDKAGLIGFGKIHTDVPLIKGSAIDIIFDQDGIKIRKIFDTGEIKVPPPFKITDSSLELYAATSGIGIKGEASFEINRVGKGKLGAMANSAGEFALEGTFDFDSKTFNPAQIKAAYRNGEFSASGEIGIPKGKVKGLKSAHFKVDYAKGVLTASGNAEPDMKGVKQADMHASFSKDQLVIGGSFTLDENIPGIQSGSGMIEVSRGADEIYHVKASGTAVPKIPKINTSLFISYDDGALTIEGKASYTADRVSGEVMVGATNRAISPDGTPSGPAGDHFTAYGSGSLTLKVTEWLKATASVRVTPKGEIEVVGRLDLPSAVDVFPVKAFNKELFKVPTIQIPIFAIPLGPRSIGIVATIDGGLDFDASIGPGQLKDVFGQIEFNPSHPEDTRITGGAKFVIPAHAGIKLHAALGVGLSIGPASVTGGIEIVGGLGLEGEASAAADLAWSPTTGFEFNAVGEIEVHPKFTFDVNAFLKAELDLWLFDISKEWRHNLASFSYGPEMQIKVSMPIHYKDGEPFDIKMDDLKVTYPDISISDMAGGLASKVKDEMI